MCESKCFSSNFDEFNNNKLEINNLSPVYVTYYTIIFICLIVYKNCFTLV